MTTLDTDDVVNLERLASQIQYLKTLETVIDVNKPSFLDRETRDILNNFNFQLTEKRISLYQEAEKLRTKIYAYANYKSGDLK